jgi:hypothetical protein
MQKQTTAAHMEELARLRWIGLVPPVANL